MLIVKYKSNTAELQYSLDIILKEFLGLDYQFQKEPVEYIEISQPNEKKKLTLNADFFNIIEKHWLSPKSMPVTPLKQWQVKNDLQAVNLVEPSIPIIYGKSGFKQIDKNHWHLGLDIFGSSFFMLSRYEEAITLERDNHDRFPATASIAYEAKFLDRPIVDEYVEILWSVIKIIWSNLERKKRISKTFISCDVDAPYSPATKSWFYASRQIGGDLLRRKNIKLAATSLLNTIVSRLGNYSFESYDTFEWIMDVNEQVGNEVTFFFIADHSGGVIDGCYSLKESRIQALMQKMHGRGHQIGLHGSYNTYQNAEQIQKETSILENRMKDLKIKQASIGCRQHYLRWKTPDTAAHLDNAGFCYDTSLSFADSAGFRCGTSHEYKMYDLNNRKKLSLKQRPLIVMECSIIASRYMGLGYSKEAMNIFLKYKNRCKQFNGNFSLLWHNSHFSAKQDKAFYKELIK